MVVDTKLKTMFEGLVILASYTYSDRTPLVKFRAPPPLLIIEVFLTKQVFYYRDPDKTMHGCRVY